MERFMKTPIINYILYTCNGLFALFGLLLGVVGIAMINNIGDLTKYPNASDIKTLPILVILSGCFIITVAILGNFGVYIENAVFLIIYAGTTFVLFALHLAMLIWIFINISDYPNTMSVLVQTAWYQNSLQNGYPMDVLQIQFDCCGRFGPIDYIGAGLEVPNSCCGDWILADCPEKVYLTKRGCQNEFYDFWADNINIIRFSTIVLVVAELFALFFTVCFVRILRWNRFCCY